MNDSLQLELEVSNSKRCRTLELYLTTSQLVFFPSGQKACWNVEESERLVETLQADISALKRRLNEKRQSGAGKGLLLSLCQSTESQMITIFA